MRVHFFTDEDDIVSQTAGMAFGPLPTLGGIEKYNLESKFNVVADAHAYAIVKSLIIVLDAGSDVVNIAMLPLQDNHAAGLPIRFIIYRGIKRSSLLTASNDMQPSDDTWENGNILKIIEQNQVKINAINETDVVANSEVLGLQFSTFPDTTYLENLFSDETIDFNPLIVPRGCQIGKFKGGSTPAGVELILDTIDAEPTVGLLSAEDHVFEIPAISPDGLPADEAMKIRFVNRTAKESILSYIDVTAFYGSCKNQGIGIINIPESGNDFLSTHLNNNVVYLDIRDDRGYSYNHFMRSNDSIDVGFFNSSNDMVFTETDYYQDWPILRISDASYQTARKYIQIMLPITIGMPENSNALVSYTKGMSLNKKRRSKRFLFLNQQNADGEISFNKSEAIRLTNWKYNNNKLGANYYLFKKSTLASKPDSKPYSSVWNSFFSLKMKNLFDITNIQNGQFQVKSYSSLNAPLKVSTDQEELYFPTIGIAADKHKVTFFSFFNESVFKKFIRTGTAPKQIVFTGKYKFALNQDLAYDDQQSLGFLYEIAKRLGNFRLAKTEFTDPDVSPDVLQFAQLERIGNALDSDKYTRNFEALTLTHEEYNHLISLSDNAIADNSFFQEHAYYVNSANYSVRNYPQFSFVSTVLGMGLPRLSGTVVDNNLAISMDDYPDPITISSEEIVLTSINLK